MTPWIEICCGLLHDLMTLVRGLPPAARVALLAAAGIGLYKMLGNSRSTPARGGW